MKTRTAWSLAILVSLVTLSEVAGSDLKTEEEAGNDAQKVSKLMPALETKVDEDIARVGEFFDDLFDLGEKNYDPAVGEGRTFAIKRLQFMLLPVMYKMGVMTTLLGVLTVISLKSLLIGVILLVVKLGSFLAKFNGGWQPQAAAPVQGWSPPQPIHVHVHSDGGQKHHGQAQSYGPWEPPSGPYSTGPYMSGPYSSGPYVSGPYSSGPGDDEHYYYKG